MFEPGTRTLITAIIPLEKYFDDDGAPWEPQQLEYNCPCCKVPTYIIVGDSCCAPTDELRHILEYWDGCEAPRLCPVCERTQKIVQ